MNIILLSGGSGTRLWPLSNEVRSKQFLKIFRTKDGTHESMVQRMYRMIKEADPNAEITIATSKDQLVSINTQLGEGVSVSTEPCRKDTFPAIALACCYLHDIKGINPNAPIVVCPIDPLVDESYFESLKLLAKECETGKADLTLMGIEPTFPSEKYGYIIPDDNNRVWEFKEKPNAKTAEEYISKGALWNSGVFCFKLEYLLKKSEELCGVSEYSKLLSSYETLNKISFDYAVAEHEKDIRVIRYSGNWKDLGTWNTFTEAMTDAASGNVIMGEDCQNTHIVNELSLPIVALGLKDVAVVATPDGILVTDKASSSQLKKYVPQQRPMYEKRIWGEYRVLDYVKNDDGENCLTKELIIEPGKNISYQKHHHRTEMWTFIKGEGILVIDGVQRRVRRGDFICIEPEMLHAIKAINELHIIEVQLGDRLTEEDIERFDYTW